jgi:hypothetical protein
VYSKGFTLAIFDALERLEFHTDDIHRIPPILNTIASSSRLATVSLVLADVGAPLPEAWVRLDSELYALADRIRLARGSGGDVWRLRVVFSATSPVSGRDFRVWGEQVLPRSSGGRCIEIVTEFDRRVGQGGF